MTPRVKDERATIRGHRRFPRIKIGRSYRLPVSLELAADRIKGKGPDSRARGRGRESQVLTVMRKSDVHIRTRAGRQANWTVNPGQTLRFDCDSPDIRDAAGLSFKEQGAGVGCPTKVAEGNVEIF